MSETVNVELWNLRAPLDPPIVSPRGAVTETCLLLAFAADGAGHRGVGYASFRRPADMALATEIARKLARQAPAGLAGLLDIERQQEATCENNAAAKCAACALSLAAWDLAGKQRGVACADLWGRAPGRDSLECYASALWLDKSPDELIAEARAHQANHYRYVKMRVSRSLEENLARIDAVRQVYAQPRTIALETGSEWDADMANAFLNRCQVPLLWVEDPAPHDTLHLVHTHPLNTIAAGEKATTAVELYELYTRGRLRNLIIDVQYVGGPVRFMEAARALSALGATIGAHRFSHYAVHLIACLPKSLPIEMLDWTNPAFHPLANPDSSGRLPVQGPGFHIQLDQAVINRYGLKIAL